MKSDNVPEVPEDAMHSTLETYKQWNITILNSGPNFYYRIRDIRFADDAVVLEGSKSAYLSQAEALTAAKKHVDRLSLRDRLIEIADTFMQSCELKSKGVLYVEFLEKIKNLAESNNND